MTIGDESRFPAAASASALIVGLDCYDLPGWGMEGAARSAVRFAKWLLDKHHCLPGRTTLMIRYDHEVNQDQQDFAMSLDKEIDILERAGVAVVDFAEKKTRDAFDQWVEGDRLPKAEDDYFYLFWDGHGYTSVDEEGRKLCLIGADSCERELPHIKLEDLLGTISQLAPTVHKVVFPAVCRKDIPSGWKERLKKGYSHTIPPSGSEREDRKTAMKNPRKSIFYAALDGQSTGEAGFDYVRFADLILDELDTLGDGDKPTDLFRKVIRDETHLLRGEFSLEVVMWDGVSSRTPSYVPSVFLAENLLSHAEWDALVGIADQIDAAAATAPPAPGPTLADLCRAAYCKVVGLAKVVDSGTAEAGQLQGIAGLGDLIDALRWEPVQPGQAPSVVIACDLVATRLIARNPEPRLITRYPGLASWCDGWGAGGADAGEETQNYRAESWRRLRARRPVRFAANECLSITIEGKDSAGIAKWSANPEEQDSEDGNKYYSLTAKFWAYGAVVPVSDHCLVAANEIVGKANELLGIVRSYGVVRDPLKILVEFVLPRDLLARRLEYEGSPRLGDEVPVSFRDLERQRRRDLELARQRVIKKLRLVDEYESETGPWSARIVWLPCDKRVAIDKKEIDRLVKNNEIFVLVLFHGLRKSFDGASLGIPDELDQLVDSGAAIVLSLDNVFGCDECVQRITQDPFISGTRCRMTEARIDDLMDVSAGIPGKVDDAEGWPEGLRELPSILRDLRDSDEECKLHYGVLFENEERLIAESPKLTSGAWESRIRRPN